MTAPNGQPPAPTLSWARACLAAMRWAGLTEIVYGADSDTAARAGFQDKELHDLFQRPRDTWPMTVRQQPHDRAEDPLNEWGRGHQAD